MATSYLPILVLGVLLAVIPAAGATEPALAALPPTSAPPPAAPSAVAQTAAVPPVPVPSPIAPPDGPYGPAGPPRQVKGFPDPVDRKPLRPPLVVAPDALCPQWWEVAWDLGWAQGELPHLDVVMHRESRCIPDVWNRRDPNGGSRGLLQVNGSWTRWLREQGILEEKENLFDPEVNLAAALAIYRYGLERYGFGWGPWGFRYVDPYPG